MARRLKDSAHGTGCLPKHETLLRSVTPPPGHNSCAASAVGTWSAYNLTADWLGHRGVLGSRTTLKSTDGTLAGSTPHGVVAKQVWPVGAQWVILQQHRG